MKKVFIFLLFALFFCDVSFAEQTASPEITAKGYKLVSSMTPEAKHVGQKNSALNDSLFGNVGFDFSEYSRKDGVDYLQVVHDTTLNKPVLRFDIHITPVVDGDGARTDRQRNELKTTHTNRTWKDSVNGQEGKWQVLEWKVKVPKDFQPLNNFCHIHQIKAQDGSANGSPIITHTLRANADGSNKRLQVEHNAEGGGRKFGTKSISWDEFADEWLQITQEMHFRHDGFFAVKITRIRDGKILLDFKEEGVGLYRQEATIIRSKYGIYRSLGGSLASPNRLLKNESIFMGDFMIYGKNVAPNPAQAVME